MFLEEKLVVTKQDTASKDTFFLIDLIYQSNIGLKTSHQKMKNVTRGGGRGGPGGVQKSVTYYLNGPLFDLVTPHLTCYLKIVTCK
jgi:hypothetical protein